MHGITHGVFRPHWKGTSEDRLARYADSLYEVDSEDVEVMAVKRASRGDGLVARLYSPVPVEGEVSFSARGLHLVTSELNSLRCLPASFLRKMLQARQR